MSKLSGLVFNVIVNANEKENESSREQMAISIAMSTN